MENRTFGNQRSVFRVFIHHADGRVEDERSFTEAIQAERYFKELCTTRSITPAAVIGIAGRSMRKYFRIDEDFSDYQRRVKLLDFKWVD